MIKRAWVNVIIFLLFCCSSFVVGAQPPGPPPANPVPISGIELLVGAGVIFGVKRIADMRKSKT